MSESPPGRLARISNMVSHVRNFISNLFFFGFLLFLGISLFAGGPGIEVPDGGALVIDPAGRIVEQETFADPLEAWLMPDSNDVETELAGILKAIHRAAEDPRIRIIVLDLDNLIEVSTAHADAISAALLDFRTHDKQVIAYGSSFSQPSYLIASAADAIYLHPFGEILLPGYRIENLYYANLLERLKINVHVFRAGRYKEFVEPYTRNDMSPEAREANAELVAGLWEHYSDRIIENRRLEPDRFEQYTQFPDRLLQETDGDMARMAIEYHLADELLTPDEAHARVADLVGLDDAGDYRQISFIDYLAVTSDRSGDDAPSQDEGQAIGVITAEGPIVMADSLEGVIGANPLIRLIREAREDPEIGAVVLRVSSPGGSSFASELIRQELELTQLAGKPVVISMGPVAASGGYWIAATANAIVAEPTTITGSIGVFGIFPTFENSLAAIGVQGDGVATSSVGALNPARPLTPATGDLLQASTDNIYRRFVHLVASGRDLPVAQVEDIAEGRVWLGSTARDLGLVDLLGDEQTAIERAAELASIEAPVIHHLRQPLSPGELFLQALSRNLSQLVPATSSHGAHSALGAFARRLESDWRVLNTLDDPRHSYAICGACAGIRGGLQAAW